jgi:hypothetical protein
MIISATFKPEFTSPDWIRATATSAATDERLKSASSWHKASRAPLRSLIPHLRMDEPEIQPGFGHPGAVALQPDITRQNQEIRNNLILSLRKAVPMILLVKSGDWGIGGKTLTTDVVKQVRAHR